MSQNLDMGRRACSAFVRFPVLALSSLVNSSADALTSPWKSYPPKPIFASSTASGLRLARIFPACLNESKTGVISLPLVTQADRESRIKFTMAKSGVLVTASRRILAGPVNSPNIGTWGRFKPFKDSTSNGSCTR